MIKTYKSSLFFVTETHIPFHKGELFWKGLGYDQKFVQEARGHAGGIWVLSNRLDINFTLLHPMNHCITFPLEKKLMLKGVVWRSMPRLYQQPRNFFGIIWLMLVLRWMVLVSYILILMFILKEFFLRLLYIIYNSEFLCLTFSLYWFNFHLSYSNYWLMTVMPQEVQPCSWFSTSATTI